MQHFFSLIKMITGYWHTQMLYVVAKLGIPDLLKDGPKSIDELAHTVEVNPRSLYRLLRALASVGIFTEVETDRFALAPMGELLQTKIPGSMRAIAIMHGEEWQWQPWGKLLEAINTGSSQFEPIFDCSFYEYLTQNEEANKTFNLAMTGISFFEDIAILSLYNFSSVDRLVDIGGGQGNLLVSILKAHPHLKGVLFDLPQVVVSAQQHVVAEGLVERCEVVCGDYFESVPKRGDVYMLKRVIHGWDDERAIALLQNCHQAMSQNSKLLLVDMVIPPGNEPFLGKFIDVNMLLVRGGYDRTAIEFEALLNSAGFKLTEITQPTETLLSLIEAVPVFSN